MFVFIVPASNRGERKGDRLAEFERRAFVAKRDKATTRAMSRELGREIGRRLRDSL